MPKDVDREMRIAYDTALYGNVKRLNGDNVPFYSFFVNVGENPDVYGIYSHPGNANIPNASMINIKTAIQLTVVVKTLSNDGDELEYIVSQIKNIIQPNAASQILNVDGFQVISTDEYNDIFDAYPDSTLRGADTGAAKMVMERKIFYSHILLDKTRFITN